VKVTEDMVERAWAVMDGEPDKPNLRDAFEAALEPLPEPEPQLWLMDKCERALVRRNAAEARVAELEAKLAEMPEPGSTIIELNKRVRALQIRLERARKAGFDVGDEP
jgi:hypothetical protein